MKENGYMTIYLALTLGVMISLCLALIEGCRYRGICLETECVMDIGMDSILAEYHRELFAQYNLFAVDCSYGTEHGTTKLKYLPIRFWQMIRKCMAIFLKLSGR